MTGYIQIYEQNCIVSKSHNKYDRFVLVTDEKKYLKSSEIAHTAGKLMSTLVIGTFVVPIDVTRQITIHNDKILNAYVTDGIITIIAQIVDNPNVESDNEIIYCEQLGENVTLNIDRTRIHIMKTNTNLKKRVVY